MLMVFSIVRFLSFICYLQNKHKINKITHQEYSNIKNKMFSLKILNGPLNGFEMTLSPGSWYIYTYTQEQEAVQLRIANNADVASDNVIFIPLFENENSRHIQLQLDATNMNCLSGWADEPTLHSIALQEKICQGSLVFALKLHQDSWMFNDNDVTPSDTEKALPPIMELPSRQRRSYYLWLTCGLALLMLAVILSDVLSWPVSADALSPQLKLTPAVKQSMYRHLTDAGVAWLTLNQDDKHQLSLHILTDQPYPEVAPHAEQVLRQAFPTLGSIVVIPHTLHEFQQALQALFQLAGVKYHQVMAPDGIYISVRQSLTPETLDYLNRQLKAFYQRWGQERVHISVQFPPAWGKSPQAQLQWEDGQLIWDSKNHIFLSTTTSTF
jgi:hypothetical protein